MFITQKTFTALSTQHFVVAPVGFHHYILLNKHLFGDPCENRTPRLQLERLVSYTNLTKGPCKSSTRIALETYKRSGFYEPPDIFYERSVLMYAGAADGNRTRMMFPPWDFKSHASASSATAAYKIGYKTLNLYPLEDDFPFCVF